jgi:cobyrinic acid a,c-diamide synthase
MKGTERVGSAMRGIVFAGTHSGCGKTTVTLGILAALRKKGLVAQPFKTGPDFIDAGLHGVVTGRVSRNLDQWMCGRDYVLGCFRKHAADVDIAVVEGVMGMYDGDFSTADLSRLLEAPVVLVVDAYGMAESAGAMVKGFADFGAQIADCGMRDRKSKSEIRNPKSEIKFAGVIFNRVASENHFKRLKESVRDVPVFGYLPRELNFEIPHRHLGLRIAEENPLAGENIDRLAETVLSHVNIDEVIRHAGLLNKKEYHREGAKDAKESTRFKVAVAYDKAFSFYYEDNLDLLRDAGAEIIRFSPLADPVIPAGVDAVYIGGGYPELHAEALSLNAAMLGSIRAWADAGGAIYAECGGLMYLSKGIRNFDNVFSPMAGIFPFETRMLRKPKLAYREIVLNEDCILGTSGERIRGHEFHYSEIEDRGQKTEDRGQKRIYSVRDKNGLDVQIEGFRVKNTLASYIHVHFGSNMNIAKGFAAFVKGERTA